MNNLRIKFCGDPILREKSTPVEKITPDVLNALDEMVKIMDSQSGVGLAAPQVGISQRFLVMKEVEAKGETGIVLKMLNPCIISVSEKNCTIEEGCLSVVDKDGIPVYADVVRPDSLVVEWMDENGKIHSKEFNGFAARIVQHEIDHLDGKLFIDYLSSVKREMIMNKVKKRKDLV